jgi:hypothetical protein
MMSVADGEIVADKKSKNRSASTPSVVMPGFMPGIHVLAAPPQERRGWHSNSAQAELRHLEILKPETSGLSDKPGHDGENECALPQTKIPPPESGSGFGSEP